MKWTNSATGKTIEIFNEDCMPALEKMKENEFELAVVDPPYGKRPTRGINGFGKSDKIRFQPSDDTWDIKPNKNYFNILFKKSKNQIIWGGNYFIDNLFPTNCFIVWDKLTGKNPYSDCELAWTSFGSVTKKYTQLWLGSHCYDICGLIHPTQKPVALYKWLLKNYAKPNDRILDTHLGSGSIAIACWDMGYDLVGYELDKDYFEATCKRLDEHFRQQTLF